MSPERAINFLIGVVVLVALVVVVVFLAHLAGV